MRWRSRRRCSSWPCMDTTSSERERATGPRRGPTPAGSAGTAAMAGSTGCTVDRIPIDQCASSSMCDLTLFFFPEGNV
jgi:hypothetical protein